MKSYPLFLAFLLLPILLLSQNDVATLSGYIKDAGSSETLIGATVYLSEFKKGTAANEYGFYSIEVPLGTVQVEYSFIGYQLLQKTIEVKGDMQLDIELASGQSLEEVVVVADSYKEVVNSTQMSVEKLSMQEAKLLPALFGEVDIIKTLQLKPGVQSGGEGTSGLNIRGGSSDQNLFVLDEATVYNPNHLFGFFSTFNSDAVKDVQLFKGGFPAQYGGRLSSIIDVKLNEGNRKKFSGAGGIGLIASRLTLEGPLKKEKGSFIVSGRRTYADIITRQVNKLNEDKEDYNPIPDYYFYDLNVKANYDISDKDRIFISGYYGRDVFGFQGNTVDFNFNWGNTTATARWNHIYNSRLFSNATLTFSDYAYEIKNRFGNLATFSLTSGIRDYTAKLDYFYSPNNKHNIKFGLNATYHTFIVGRLRSADDAGTFDYQAGQNFDAFAGALYFNDDYEVSDNLKLNFGLRWSSFYNDKFYQGIEPRFAARYRINDALSVKASYANMVQYIHLVANSSASLPTDLWYPSTGGVQPQRSNQVAGGISWNIGDMFLLTNEAYYKWSKDQIDFKEGAQLFVNDKLEEEFVFGKGYSYGNEIYLEKKKGNFTGWIGYTLAWSWRQFPDILDGKRFHPYYDRRHDLSVVLLWKINKRHSLTGTWIYSTGNLTTLPIGRFFLQGIGGTNNDGQADLIPVYTDRNSFRLASYHRADLSYVWKFFHKWGESDLTFSVYNAYDRRNPFFVYIETLEDEQENFTGVAAKQVSLFPVLPSVTWNFKF